MLHLTDVRCKSRHFVRWGRQHKRPLQAFFNLAPPVAAVLAAAAACLLVREAWAALRFWLAVSAARLFWEPLFQVLDRAVRHVKTAADVRVLCP